MNNQVTKRFVAILLIICISLGGGIAINELWNAFDRRMHPMLYVDIIYTASLEFGVPQYIIYATIKVESDFDPYAESSAGALGLMQMMPDTFGWLTSDEHLGENLSRKKLEDPETSIRYGTYYLSYLYRRFDYNWHTAFAAYNGGEGNVVEWLQNPNYSDMNGNLTDIPFKETKNYVKKINAAIKTYQNLYPEIQKMK